MYNSNFEVTAQKQASPAAQIEYLMTCLTIAQSEIATLQTELATRDLKSKLGALEFEREMEAMLKIRERYKIHAMASVTRTPPTRRRWKFWRRES